MLYPALEKRIPGKGYFGDITLPQLLKIPPYAVIVALTVMIVFGLFLLKYAGL